MQSRGGGTQGDKPTSRELEDFGSWLRAEAFETNPDPFKDRLLTVYDGWLKSREYEVNKWIYDFDTRKSELHKTLTDIQSNLIALYKNMDTLYGSRSNLAITSLEISEVQQNLFDGDFLPIYRRLHGILDDYIMYVNAYETKYKAGELLDTSPMDRKPDKLAEELIQELRGLAELLAHLADSLSAPQAATNSLDAVPGGPPRRARAPRGHSAPQGRRRGA